jgi:signal transduction histidine kinase
MSTTAELAPDFLRGLFLFESLTDEQVDWIAEHADVVDVPAGQDVCLEGEPARCFWVLCTGEIAVIRKVRGDEIEVSRSDRPGTYGGATEAYVEGPNLTYKHTLRACSDTRLLALPARDWGQKLRSWFPLAMHLVEGLAVGMQRSNSAIGERERLLALGSLSAGLTHELNNPAAAAIRATESLRDRVAGMRHKLAMLASGKLDGAVVSQLVELQEEAVLGVATAPELTAMQTSDAEDEVGDWLDERSVGGAWDLAAVLVAGGLDAQWLAKVERTVPDGTLEAAVRWIAYAVETETLMGEITDSTVRIGTLVNAARQYSQLDRAPYQPSDLRVLLKSTLTMLSRKLEGIELVKDFDPELPQVPCYPAELNQVWTNIVDNAVGAMAGSGTLTVRTRRESDTAVVEIADTGPGIPEEIRPRIFEPFFTTKDVGEGTGLGLDISYRIVVTKHHGDIRVHTSPAGTTFEIRLPLS